MRFPQPLPKHGDSSWGGREPPTSFNGCSNAKEEGTASLMEKKKKSLTLG